MVSVPVWSTLFLSSRLPLANQPYMLIVQGLVFAVIYYFLFRFIIVKFNLNTPGRGEELDATEEAQSPAGSSEDKFAAQAQVIYEGLGGKENIVSVDNCATRLRLEVKDIDKVDQNKIKSTGVPGIKVTGRESLQVIVGTSVQFVADELKKIVKSK